MNKVKNTLEDVKCRAEWFWDSKVVEWKCDCMDKIDSILFRFKRWRRSSNRELVELDAFRELIEVERKLGEWPRAVPLLERALHLYDITSQVTKREEMRARIAHECITHSDVQGHFDFECNCDDRAGQTVESVCRPDPEVVRKAQKLVDEHGRISAAVLQRGLGIGYNAAVELCGKLRSPCKK